MSKYVSRALQTSTASWQHPSSQFIKRLCAHAIFTTVVCMFYHLMKLAKSTHLMQIIRLLFCPGVEHMHLYPALLTGDPDSPSDLRTNQANKVQATVLAHLWLVHGRCWSRMRPFIEAGGLRSAVILIVVACRPCMCRPRMNIKTLAHQLQWHFCSS